MRNLGINEIRKEFLEFFKKNNHTILKSFSLVPENDKSLLLINAGMAPLKQYFTGEKKMKNDRASSSQRCVRTQDIERVGKTERHATFFEMLGNFSFGDYFKHEAIRWGYEFITSVMQIDKDLIWVTVYEDDDEAYDIWKDEIKIPEERILRFGKEDNFWELEVGPCGPCSEIYVDRGIEHAVDENDVKPGNDNSDRFMEVWNLVFTQFNKDEQGNYHKLKHPNIDTGMGLERLAMILQKKDNIFEIRSMQNIIAEVEKISNKTYKKDDRTDVSIRVITDHAKAVTFMALDGIIPSNDKRGYVMRRLIRRALRHGKLLGIEGKFLNRVVDRVIETYNVEYSDLEESKDRIHEIIESEEIKFQKTINQGLEILNEMIEQMHKENVKILDGFKAFTLYDTYGFPIDLTLEILNEKNLSVDMDTFNAHMKVQREKARQAREVDGGWNNETEYDLDGLVPTQFEGYEKFEGQYEIIRLLENGQQTDVINNGKKGIIISDKTIFYAEGGGQVADTGIISTADYEAFVYDVQKNNEVYLHFVEVKKGDVYLSKANFSIDKMRRLDITRNHSATHLLDQALIDVLGSHIKQQGSLVDQDKLRFDISHYKKIDKDQLLEIEKIVNKRISEQLNVTKEIMSFEQSRKKGAIGLFEDKYKDEVRVVSMGDYSVELCGGCHVNNTSEILMFKIISESSSASGVRRIEATTGRHCYEMLLDKFSFIEKISDALNCDENNIINKINQLHQILEENKKTIYNLKNNSNKDLFIQIENEIKKIMDGYLVVKRFEKEDSDTLKDLENRLKTKYRDIIIIFANIVNGKIVFMVSVAGKMLEHYHAGKIVKNLALRTGGNGGGRNNFAQAGAKDVDKLDDVLAEINEIL